jgi:hypothetical protein
LRNYNNIKNYSNNIGENINEKNISINKNIKQIYNDKVFNPSNYDYINNATFNSSRNKSYNNIINDIKHNDYQSKINYKYFENNSYYSTKSMNPIYNPNRSTIIKGNKDYNIINNINDYKISNNNTGFNFPRNVSSSDMLSQSKRIFNIKDKTPSTGKNKITNHLNENRDIPKLRANYSTNDINSNNKQTRSFFGLINNNNYNYNFHSSISASDDQSQNNPNNNFSGTMNNNNKYNYNRNYAFSNTILEKLDKNVNINEKVISSPFQIYQTYQDGVKKVNYPNRGNQSLNAGKRILFDSNKEKDKKNKNSNNNYKNNYYNLKGKEAIILQNLVYNLQSNIPEYDKHFINDEDVKNMKNKSVKINK